MGGDIRAVLGLLTTRLRGTCVMRKRVEGSKKEHGQDVIKQLPCDERY